MPALTPWSVRLREVLADGRWHSRNELVTLAGPFVPPERAIRVREGAASHSNSKQRGALHGSGPRPQRSYEFRLAVGRRRLVVDALGSMGSQLERTTIDGVVHYRATSPSTLRTT